MRGDAKKILPQRHGGGSKDINSLGCGKRYSKGCLMLDLVGVNSTTNGKRRMKGTKVHVLATKDGIPLRLALSGGNLHDSKLFFELVGSSKLQGKRGRPRSWPGELAADKAHDSRKVREYLRRRGIRGSIPQRKGGIYIPKIFFPKPPISFKSLLLGS